VTDSFTERYCVKSNTNIVYVLFQNSYAPIYVAGENAGREDSGWRDMPMEATAAAILVQAMLQSSPPLQGSLREDLQKGGPQAGADFLKPYFIAVARMLQKAEEKG
jgi:hypothetical protein